jgi:hypothetical protein
VEEVLGWLEVQLDYLALGEVSHSLEVQLDHLVLVEVSRLLVVPVLLLPVLEQALAFLVVPVLLLLVLEQAMAFLAALDFLEILVQLLLALLHLGQEQVPASLAMVIEEAVLDCLVLGVSRFLVVPALNSLVVHHSSAVLGFLDLVDSMKLLAFVKPLAPLPEYSEQAL